MSRLNQGRRAIRGINQDFYPSNYAVPPVTPNVPMDYYSYPSRNSYMDQSKNNGAIPKVTSDNFVHVEQMKVYIEFIYGNTLLKIC